LEYVAEGVTAFENGQLHFKFKRGYG
jgi:hypothetical protein